MVTLETVSARQRIVQHVERYHVTTISILHRLFYEGKTDAAVRKAASKLVEQETLDSFKIDNMIFYQRPNAGNGSQRLWERYAVLVFCCGREERRRRLLPREFQHHFPEIVEQEGISPAHQSYYLEETGPVRLGRILVDSDADTARVVRKCRETLRHAAQTPGLLDLVDHRLFVISVLTAEQSKADAIAQALAKEQLTPNLFEFHAIPELNKLINLTGAS